MTNASVDETCRIDVWLWRARFFKSRSLACRFVEGGRLRLVRGDAQVRIDKPGRAIRAGDGLVFALGGRAFSITVLGVGQRRGAAIEARSLYIELTAPAGQAAA